MNLLKYFILFLLLSSFTKKVITLNIDEKQIPIKVEVAKTTFDQKQGLMGRKKLNKNSGMLFEFEEENFYSFWMKHTHIPLLILFFNADGTLVDIKEGIPYSTKSLRTKRKSKYVLEINKTFFKDNNISPNKIISLAIN